MSRDCARIRDPFARRAFERAERKERLLAFLDRAREFDSKACGVSDGLLNPGQLKPHQLR
jgi:hypothetical protein